MSYIEPVIEAFLKGTNIKIINTESKNNALFLFGNKIAWIDIDNNLWIQDCGWVSVTIQDRLNKLPNVQLKHTAGNWYLNTTGKIAKSIKDYGMVNPIVLEK
jgi:hypothetical protein